MSKYASYDHARWVQSSITALKASEPGAKERRAAAEHKGWYAAPEELNDFQRRAIGILGIVGGGIYNAPIGWKSVYWAADFIAVPWRNSLATFDFSELTTLVFLCHEARIRACVAPRPLYLEITLSQRMDVGDVSRRHPGLDEALLQFRGWFSADHPIVGGVPR